MKTHVWLIQNVRTGNIAYTYLTRKLAREIKFLREKYCGGKYRIIKKKLVDPA